MLGVELRMISLQNLHMYFSSTSIMFQAICLHRGTVGVGGATPGKKVFSLRVVRCEWMAPTLNDQAIVYPATDIG